MRSTLFLNKICVVTILTVLLCVQMLQAQHTLQTEETIQRVKKMTGTSIIGFLENKGQIVDQNSVPNPAVRYLYNYKGFNVQLRATGFSYDTYYDEVLPKVHDSVRLAMPNGKFEVPPAGNRHYHRVDVELKGCNFGAALQPSDETGGYNNYYLNDREALFVKSYQKVVYKEIYKNIDLEFYLDTDGAPEYQFVIHPGGKIKDIRLEYSGADSTLLNNGRVRMYVQSGLYEEHIPLSYEVESRQSVDVAMIAVGKNVYGYQLRSALKENSTLIIDPKPNRIWGTYYGGTGAEWGYNTKVSTSGNVFVCGTTSSSTSVASSGAHQSTYGGSNDAFIVKFSSNGTREWGTYYGGNADDQGSDLAVSSDESVYCTGYATSTTGIATSGAHQTSVGGSNDAFIVKFNTSGVRQWGTYYGGGGWDGGVGIRIAQDGSIVMVGWANSGNNIGTSGTYQPNHGGGASDGFIVKFNSTGTRQWGTYCGGNGYDYLNACVISADGSIYCCGTTNSASNIASSGAHQQNIGNGGSYDGMIHKFNSDGTRDWGTYYGGTQADYCDGLALSNSESLYVRGGTVSYNGNSIATAGSYQSSLNGNAMDQFLVKFSSGGVRQWGTYYGGICGEPQDYTMGNGWEPNGIVCGSNGAIYLIGTTCSSASISTAGSYQVAKGSASNGYDAFIAKFDSTGSLTWGTYYGGTNDENGSGIDITTDGMIYCTGITNSTNAISTSGAFQTSLGGSSNDMFLVKFMDCITLPTVDPGTSRSICSGDTTVLGTSPASGYTYAWTPKNTLDDSTKSNPKAFPTTTTKYYLTVTNSSGCDKIDSVTVTVNPKPNVGSGTVSDVCVGDTATYNLTGSYAGHTFSWQALGGVVVGASTNQSVTVKWTRSGADTLLAAVTNSYGCSATGKIYLTANPRSTVNASTDKEICSGSSVTLNASATGGTGALTYNWSPTSGLSNASSLQPVASPAATTQYILTVNDTKGCASRDTVVVTVNPRPVIDAGVDKSMCPGGQVQIGGTASSGTGSIGYSWSPSSGIVSGTATSPVIGVSPSATTNYIVTVTDSKGCDQSDTVKVTVNPKPTINAGANQATCVGVGVTIGNVATGSSGYQYSWSPSAGLSATNVAQPSAAPSATTTYKVVVSDVNGCKDSSTVEVRVRQQAATTSKSSIDFGILGACDGSKEQTFDIINTGSDDMIVNRQQMPAGFVMVTAMPITITKGSTQTVTLRYAPASQGVSQGNAVLTSDPCDYAITLPVRGEKLQLAYTTDKPTVGYGISLACNSNIQWDSVVTVQNTGTDKMTIQGASVGSVFSIVSPTTFPIDINPAGTLAVTIRYKPTTQGSFSDQVKIPFKAGTCTNEINIPVSASHIIPDAGVTPPSVSFPAMLGCDGKKDTVITISNTNGVDVTLESITGDAQFKMLTSLPLTIPVGEKRQIQLRFEPNDTGSVSVNLTITTNPCNRKSQFAVSGSKQGVNFTVADTVDLGTILPCAQSSISKQFVIKNTSGGGIGGNISNASASSGFSSTIKSGDALPNNQDKQYTVTFTPNATTPLGVSIGKLDIGFLPCDITKTVYVKATVLELNATADPSIDFGSVPTGTNRNKMIKIVNKGTSDLQISSLSGISTPLSTGVITPPLPATLKPSDTLHVEVIFTSQTGKFNQTLTASGNQPCAISTKTVINAEGTDKPIPIITGIGKNIGDVSIGKSKSDVVTITNDGTVAMNITNAVFDATSNNAFTVNTGQFPIAINVGESKQINFTFSPTVVGNANGFMIITGDQDTASAAVVGRGIDTVQSRPSITSIASLAYDSVCVGKNKRLQVTVQNNGNEDVQLQSANWLTTTNNPYNIIGFTPQTLAVGKSVTIDIDFTPTTAGIASNTVQWMCDKANASTTVNGIGKICAGPLPDTVRTTTEVSNIEAKAGEHVIVRMVLSDKQKLYLPNAPTKYEAHLKMNSTILTIEEPGITCTTIDGNNCEVIVRGIYNKSGSDTLASIHGLATLGNTDYAEIELSKFIWQDTTVTTEVQVKNGSIRITGVCEEGSVRLVMPSGSKQTLSSRPNPAKDEVKVEYGLREPMIVSLEIVNIAGQVVDSPIQLQQTSMGLHNITLDISRLASGVYQLRLTTPNGVLSSRMDILK
ncbi:MAG: choice-of-anchor D domain-containing protein [Candidatus Kapaibacterium sp.]